MNIQFKAGIHPIMICLDNDKQVHNIHEITANHKQEYTIDLLSETKLRIL